MRIAILGSGAMGSLFGSFLSLYNDVWLIDNDISKIEAINKDGVTMSESDGVRAYWPKAASDSSGLGIMDLVVLFVKSMYTVDALHQNRNLIGKDTFIMTLQNGAGHEAKLSQFVDRKNILVGTTQHNSSIIKAGHINHGGSGLTIIGVLEGRSGRIWEIADCFSICGIETIISDNIKKEVWNKLFLNTSASSLTAALQVPLGFIIENSHARHMMHMLANEAVKVANAECGNVFDVHEVIGNIERVLSNSMNGYTSIYSDIKNGNRTEVDTISGFVAEAAKRYDIEAPYHDFVVSLIHSLEEKVMTEKNSLQTV